MAFLLALPTPGAAQTAEELAKHTQNPIANLISVPLQGNWDFGLGDRDATGTVLNFQPVIPFAISKDYNLILRFIPPWCRSQDPKRTASMGSAMFDHRLLLAQEGSTHHLGRRPNNVAAGRDKPLPRTGKSSAWDPQWCC